MSLERYALRDGISGGVCFGERRTESGRETPNVLTLEKAEAGVLGDGCLI